MNKKTIISLSGISLSFLVGCNKINQVLDFNNNKNIKSNISNISDISDKKEVDFIKPGIWAGYKNPEKKDLCFYCFYDESNKDTEDTENFDGAGVTKLADIGIGSPFSYKINNQDIIFYFGSIDFPSPGKIDFEDQNNFIITYDEYKDSPEKFEFVSGNLEEFDFILSDQEISESFLNYYNLDPETNIILDNKDFKNIIIKYNNKIYSINRFTGILIDDNNQEVDLLNQK